MRKLGEKKTMIYCEYKEVNKIIQEEFDLPVFEIVAAEECGNDCTLEFNVCKGDLDKWDRKHIEEEDWIYQTRIYLCDLADRDIIEEGKYFVKVSW